jgi:hypothetical protein
MTEGFEGGLEVSVSKAKDIPWQLRAARSSVEHENRR